MAWCPTDTLLEYIHKNSYFVLICGNGVASISTTGTGSGNVAVISSETLDGLTANGYIAGIYPQKQLSCAHLWQWCCKQSTTGTGCGNVAVISSETLQPTDTLLKYIHRTHPQYPRTISASGNGKILL